MVEEAPVVRPAPERAGLAAWPGSLRAQLFALTCVIGLPLIGLAASAVWTTYETGRERAAVLLQSQTRTMALQVDAEFERAELLLRTIGRLIAAAPNEGPDWRGELRAAAGAYPDSKIELLPAGADVGFAPGTIRWSDLKRTDVPGRGEIWIDFLFERPVSPEARGLRLRLQNDVFTRILAAQRFSGERVAAVLDRDDVIVARARRAEEMVGRTATADLRAQLGRLDEGVLSGLRTQEGVASVAAHARAPLSRYAVATALPEHEFSGPLRAALLRTVSIGAALLAGALALAWMVSRRVIRAIELVDKASETGAPPTGLRETDALAERLAAAARDRGNALRARDRFLAMVSHELRTPMSSILAWSALLRRPDLPDDKRQRGLLAIEAGARAQAHLVDDLLDMTRMDTGTLRLDLAPVRVEGVVRAAVDAAQPSADARGIALALRLEPSLPLVNGDAARLQQVVSNLLGNAIKFGRPEGRVDIVATRTTAGVRIEVVDDGRGIDPAFLPHVFEAFRQADEKRTERQGGLGLGLAIVKTLVEAHGGRIAAASGGPGRGARFSVDLPALDGTAAP